MFLLQSLLASQPWARDYVARRGAIEVADVDEVIAQLARPMNRGPAHRLYCADRVHRPVEETRD